MLLASKADDTVAVIMRATWQAEPSQAGFIISVITKRSRPPRFVAVVRSSVLIYGCIVFS